MNATQFEQSIPTQLADILAKAAITQKVLAQRTGLSAITISNTITGRKDPRLGSISAMLDEAGYALVPIPKTLLGSVHDFVSSGGMMTSRAAGQEAPLSRTQQIFAQASAKAYGGVSGVGGGRS